ncbi:MAG: UDP-galactopyranose mutase [Adlercreutzia equolifaciens]
MPIDGYHAPVREPARPREDHRLPGHRGGKRLRSRLRRPRGRRPLGGHSYRGASFEGPSSTPAPSTSVFLGRFGRLPYRSLDFVYETFDETYHLPCGTVNYTVTEDYTRITEFKWLTEQTGDKTTITHAPVLPGPTRIRRPRFPTTPSSTMTTTRSTRATAA